MLTSLGYKDAQRRETAVKALLREPPEVASEAHEGRHAPPGGQCFLMNLPIELQCCIWRMVLSQTHLGHCNIV